jgi:hypothetical protein
MMGFGFPHAVERRFARFVATAFFALLALHTSACGGCSDPVVVRKILIDVDDNATGAGVDREAVRAMVEEIVDDERWIRVDTRGNRVLRVRVERFAATTANVNALPAGHPVVDAAAGSASTLALSVEIAEDGRTQLRAASLATRAGDVAVAALVEQALRDALAQIEQAHATDRLDNDALLAILRSDAESGQRKRRAVLALGSRRDQRATPLALPLLRDEDSATRQSALQALTLLADPRAVEAIIAFSERQPAAIRRQCIDAVKATDSPLAAAWLFVLSTGHPDVEVQAHARAALALLPPTARADAGAPQTAAVEAAN